MNIPRQGTRPLRYYSPRLPGHTTITLANPKTSEWGNNNQALCSYPQSTDYSRAMDTNSRLGIWYSLCVLRSRLRLLGLKYLLDVTTHRSYYYSLPFSRFRNIQPTLVLSNAPRPQCGDATPRDLEIWRDSKKRWTGSASVCTRKPWICCSSRGFRI